ncbi:MAG: universal stress protein [Burkholderiaceae bacterium]|jgi:nucleotide-binding universal stress UspA family protein|nr:universal stress protein [Betaproteobacteria bacterium]MDA9076207.1 universal stress protein [Burkholderiaceae bacterium]MCH9847512.1 universal stress protein [Betaproteobacteria bacterium]MDB9845087.1 universal stress protein [Burkholderiaceae bacterium]MDG1108998.1 universal stress protein [Burkholderiaceae bacterium]|tara:strand:+ start:251 stop:688 length:438 start_codon:yes stop_codon:yes gene_type:complete
MFTSILIPTDGSEKAVIAASKAVELAKEQGAKLTAVVVIDPFPYIGLGEASAFGLQAYLSEAQAMATQSLDGVRAMAEAAGVPFMAETIERSAVFEGILDAATEQGCDLIVMGSHGRSGVKALILGSETQKVLTHSRIPVLVIKS